MKKRLVFLAASFLCSSSFAWVTSTATTNPLIKYPPNQMFAAYGKHYYGVGNDSGVDQNVAVCYTITVCAETPNPAWHRITQFCDKFVLHPGEAKGDNKMSKVDFNYPFIGWCDVRVSTEIFGWQHHVSSGFGRLKVGSP